MGNRNPGFVVVGAEDSVCNLGCCILPHDWSVVRVCKVRSMKDQGTRSKHREAPDGTESLCDVGVSDLCRFRSARLIGAGGWEIAA